jgi:autotransporter-associated beta strand protein
MKTKIPHLILAGLLGTATALPASTLYWDGNDTTADANGGAGTWDTTANNWDDAATAGSPVIWNNATPDSAIFGGTAGTVTLGTAITADSLQFDTTNYVVSGNTLTLAGSATITANATKATITSIIDGSSGLTKEGTSALYLTGANTYTGATNINSGTLWLGNGGTGGSLNTASAINIASGATFRTAQSDDITQGTDFSGAAITGDGGITHNNNGGTLILNAANTYTGGTFLFRSKARVEHNDALGTGLVTLFNTGARLELVDGITLDNDITFASNGNAKSIDLASGSATISSNSTITTAETVAIHARFTTSAGATLTVDANITGSGGVTKHGDGTVIYTNATNNFTGYGNVYGGTLQIGEAGRLGGGNYSGDIAVSSGATFQYSSSASGPAAKYTGAISGDGTLIKDGSDSELRLLGNNNSIANIEINQGILRGSSQDNSLGDAGTTISLGDTSGTANAQLAYAGSSNSTTKAGITVRSGSTGTKTIRNINGTVTDNTAITLNDSVTIDDTAILTLGGVISGSGGMTKIGSGTTTLSGANTYSGNTTITAGTLQIGEAGDLNTGATNFYSGNISIASGATFQYSSSASNTAARYDGTISGDGTLIKDGSTSILRLQGTTSVANIEINQGTLRVQGNADALGGAGTTVTVGASGSENAILNYSGSNVTYTGKTAIVVGAGSSGTKTIQNGGGTNNVENTNITLNDNVIIDDSGSFSLGGVISGSGGMTKTGSGTTTLSGANTYNGDTTVSNGTLAIDGTHTGGAQYTVNAGGTLAGSGSLDALVEVNGVISPGNSPGTMSTGTQTWNDGGSYLWEINDSGGTQGADPGWDWLSITGSLELGGLSAGSFTIDIDSLNGLVAGNAAGFDTWTKGSPGDVDYSFIIATASSGITGFDADNFTLDSSGFSNAPGWDWQIKLSGGDLVLEAYAVPEPSSSALLGLGALALALRRRRA